MIQFNEQTLPSLDETLIAALKLFIENKIPKLNIKGFKKPLIAGSGNAIVTAKIIFNNSNAVFCDETNFNESLNKDIDGLIIMSASGNKHAAIFAQKAKDKNILTKLITCNNESQTKGIIGKENTTVTRKNREPYTYNTSTYLGWILAITSEDASSINNFIRNTIDPILSNFNFSDYDSYLLITPDQFAGVNQLFIVKFIELFGRKVARDVFSYEQLKHAITVVPHSKELCITFGKGELLYNGNILNLPLPENSNIGTIMSIGYYLIGKIQNSYPQYFKQNIGNYVKTANKTEFGKDISIIVE